MERIKSMETKDGWVIDLWRDSRMMDRMRICYSATVRTRGFEDRANEPGGGWVLTKKAAMENARERILQANAHA